MVARAVEPVAVEPVAHESLGMGAAPLTKERQVLAELRRLEATVAAVADMAAALDLLAAHSQLRPAHMPAPAPGSCEATEEAGEAGAKVSGQPAREPLPATEDWAGLQHAGGVQAEVSASAVRIRFCPLCCPENVCWRSPCTPNASRLVHAMPRASCRRRLRDG